ncbi:MAG TPA: ribulose bisphosphate carboxylase small subunit [Candidatus Bathyarchaeia archaeon]|nr:ribulose bisphosphate carboxylase small subunit [Candidatus Bathyarchaeia archaeon]
MRITQGTFSFLPDLTDEEIAAQVQYCLRNGWPVSVEYTDDPHPRNAYWEMWGLPMFDQSDAGIVMREISACRQALPDHYIKVNGYDRTKGRQTTTVSFIVNRPATEPGFELERTEGSDRRVHYTLRSRARLPQPHA